MPVSTITRFCLNYIVPACLWLCSSIGYGQSRQAIATYQNHRIYLDFYQQDFSEREKSFIIQLEEKEGLSPVADPYHVNGACRSMQIDRQEKYLYFLMHHHAQKDAAGSTEAYRFHLEHKKTERLFALGSSSYIIWSLLENRNSMLHYDFASASFIESHFNGNSDTLLPLQFGGKQQHLEVDSQGFTFTYSWHDSIFQSRYTFNPRQHTRQFLYVYPHFTTVRKQKLLIMMWPEKGFLTLLKSPGKKVLKTLQFSQAAAFWQSDSTLFLQEKTNISLYNEQLDMYQSYYIESPNIYEKLQNGLLLSYRRNGALGFAFLDNNMTSLTELPNIHDNFIQLICDLD